MTVQIAELENAGPWKWWTENQCRRSYSEQRI